MILLLYLLCAAIGFALAVMAAWQVRYSSCSAGRNDSKCAQLWLIARAETTVEASDNDYYRKLAKQQGKVSLIFRPSHGIHALKRLTALRQSLRLWSQGELARVFQCRTGQVRVTISSYSFTSLTLAQTVSHLLPTLPAGDLDLSYRPYYTILLPLPYPAASDGWHWRRRKDAEIEDEDLSSDPDE